MNKEKDNGNFLRGTSRKSNSKAEVIRQAKKNGETVHFQNLMDFCHLKKAEIAKQLRASRAPGRHRQGRRTTQSIIRRAWVLLNFTNGSDKICGHYFKASLCAGEANEAVSKYTQVKMTETARMLKLLEESPEI